MKGNDRIIFGIGLAALLLLLIGILPNIGLTYDSHLYLRLSENLHDEGFVQPSFASKPPLYPIFLWLLHNNLILISFFNVVCWTVSMWLLHKLLCSRIENIFYKISLATAVFFSTSIMMVHNFVWTEPSFILLIIGVLYFQVYPLKSSVLNLTTTSILLLSLVALKHLGIGLVFGFALISIWKERSFRKTAIIYFPAILFFILWQIRSYNLRGDLSRLNHSRGLDLFQNLEWIGQTILHWFEPFTVPSSVAIGLCMVIFAWLVIELKKASTSDAFFQIIPIFLILIVATKADLLQADLERYLSIIYPFFIFLILRKLADQDWSSNIWAYLPVLIFVAYSVFRTAKNAWFWHGI